MSRPFRFLVPAALATVSFSFTACVGTIYDRTYSYKKNYFKPPAEKKEASADDILKEVGGTGQPTDPGAMPPDAGLGAPPPPAGDIPGLPPAMPDAAAPAAPPAPAVPPPPL